MQEIKFDERNYRKHSKKNKSIIKKSLKELGAGRSVVIDSEDCLVAGNGVYEQAQALKMPVRVVETDGSELVVVKRTDLKTSDEKRKRLALSDSEQGVIFGGRLAEYKYYDMHQVVRKAFEIYKQSK